MNPKKYGRQYDIIVGVFGIKSNANRAKRKYQKLGYDVRLYLNDKGFQEVIIGSYPNIHEAREELEDILTEIEPQAWIKRRR